VKDPAAAFTAFTAFSCASTAVAGCDCNMMVEKSRIKCTCQAQYLFFSTQHSTVNKGTLHRTSIVVAMCTRSPRSELAS
jgi:hypothetical protein